MAGAVSLESYLQSKTKRAADIVRVDLDAVALDLLELLIILAEQVAFLPGDEIEPQARALDEVGLARLALDRPAVGHPLGGVGDEEGHLRQAVRILDADLEVGQMVGLARQRRAVLEQQVGGDRL